MKEPHDLLLVGGGLSSGLIAWALHQKRPDVHFCLVESSQDLGGNHTWSFHPSDIGLADWLRPLVSKTWADHEVRFPSHVRYLKSGYCSIRSIDFNRILKAQLGKRLLFNSHAKAIGANSVELDSGEVLTADCVLDGRGTYAWSGSLGYQKFLGHVITFDTPHGVVRPILMDATVKQQGGYRFVYTLPWDSHTLLVEDTYYSESPELNRVALAGRISDYCGEQNWNGGRVVHEEWGVLPIPITANPLIPDVLPIGLSGGFFNPTTGFSLPDAVRVAERLSSERDVKKWPEVLRMLSRDQFRRGRFYRCLNRALFWGAPEAERYRILQRFYLLPESLILSFYRGDLTPWECARIVMGRPPIPVLTLARNLWERGAHA